MISITNLKYSFGNNLILDNLNLEITPSSIHSLIGTTGAGKTVLLKLLAGLFPIQGGRISNLSKKITFVFQQNAFFPWMTIEKNLELTTQENINDIQIFLKKYNLESYLKLYPNQLSGGTLQKFNLCRAFLNDADLVLLDEPFSHLDLVQKEELYLFTLELWKKTSPTIILVTHDVEEALFLSHQVSFLSKKHKKITSDSNVKKLSESHFSSIKELRVKISMQKIFDDLYMQLKEDLR